MKHLDAFIDNLDRSWKTIQGSGTLEKQTEKYCMYVVCVSYTTYDIQFDLYNNVTCCVLGVQEV